MLADFSLENRALKGVIEKSAEASLYARAGNASGIDILKQIYLHAVRLRNIAGR